MSAEIMEVGARNDPVNSDLAAAAGKKIATELAVVLADTMALMLKSQTRACRSTYDGIDRQLKQRSQFCGFRHIRPQVAVFVWHA